MLTTTVSPFVRQYLETALWCGLADDGGDDAAGGYTLADFAPSALASAEEDCAAFLAAFGEEVKGREENAAYDLWLTRNHHGAGFWDRGAGHYPEGAGRRMTDYAHQMGDATLYVGDDGMLYFA